MTTSLSKPSDEALPVIELSAIRKGFPGVLALDNVDMRIMPGEARSLVGQNGSGKSTLIKVIAGVHKKDSGSIRVLGQEAEMRSPSHAVDLGVSTIHQEVNLIPNRSVAENLFLAREPKFGPFIRQKRLIQDSVELLGRYGLTAIDPRAPLNSLSIALRQMVAIVRAVSRDARLVIMDEPTSSLEVAEVEQLFSISRQLLEEKRSILFVSHRLDELYEICDSTTILRDGRLVFEGDLHSMDKNELVTRMIGSTVGGSSDGGGFEQATGFRSRSTDGSDPLLEVKDVQSPDLKSASISIRSGEIVGLAGLLGAGRTELAEALFGLQRQTGGSGGLAGNAELPKSPREALSQGMAFVPEDRREQGILPGQSVRDNLVAAIMPNLTRRGMVDRELVDEIVDKFIESLGIKLSSPDQPIEQLSGGNQQKVILARCLSMNPKLLIADEPTRGIDVAAKFEIQSRISDLADDGMAVLLISSELEELIEGTERTVVMRDGHSVDTLSGKALSEEGLVASMAGQEKGEE